MSDIDTHLDGRRLVKADEAQLLFEAQRIHAQAQAEAGRIVADAHRQADAIRMLAERSRAAENERGYREGLERGLADRAHEFALKDAQAAHRMTSLDERIGVLVMRTLSKVLTDRQNDERFFAGVMERVLRAAHDEKFLTVRVAIEQAQGARDAIDRLIERSGASRFIDVTPDATLKRGACIVESAHGVIDASLDTQLEAIGAALSNVWRVTPEAARTGLARDPAALVRSDRGDG